MQTEEQQASITTTQLILFGALGDLAWRLVVPALFNLYVDGRLPKVFRLIGIDRNISVEKLIERLHDGIKHFSNHGEPTVDQWSGFAGMISAEELNLKDRDAYAKLTRTIDDISSDQVTSIFYLAIPPDLIDSVATGLASMGHPHGKRNVRIVVEKPLGHDLDSFRSIDANLRRHFDESQIFRMDHFLGKETVQNLLALRFANPIFEPIWNRRYIDHVTVTVAEQVGVGNRAGYYEKAGALRDMIQNHLIQLMCLVAMEPPVTYDAEDIRNKKLDVLNACRRIRPEEVSAHAVRGQYAPGWIEGKAIQAYRDEAGIAADSQTETYAAVKLLIDNWRWQDVPFYLRTGKCLTASASEISIRFRDVPHNAFSATTGVDTAPVRLVIQIQPQEGIILKFIAKEPGSPLHLRPVDMRFAYGEAFNKPSPPAYETLLHDVLEGNAMLFMRSDQVQAAWELLMPVIDNWQNNAAPDFPNYAAGSWGPEAAEQLLACDGRSWLEPSQWHPDTVTRHQ